MASRVDGRGRRADSWCVSWWDNSLSFDEVEMTKGTEIGGRYLCEIFQDMRECYKTRNFSYLESLIGEAQYRANRMGDRLERIHSIERMEETRDRLKKEIEELEKEKS